MGRGRALAPAAPESRSLGTTRPERLRGFPNPQLDPEPDEHGGGAERKVEIREVPPLGFLPAGSGCKCKHLGEPVSVLENELVCTGRATRESYW